MFIAYHDSGPAQSFVSDSPPNPLRGVEHTSAIPNARRFADPGQVAAFVAERGGDASRYKTLEVPS